MVVLGSPLTPHGPAKLSARVCGKHSTLESVTCRSPLARGPVANLELVSTGT